MHEEWNESYGLLELDFEKNGTLHLKLLMHKAKEMFNRSASFAGRLSQNY